MRQCLYGVYTGRRIGGQRPWRGWQAGLGCEPSSQGQRQCRQPVPPGEHGNRGGDVIEHGIGVQPRREPASLVFPGIIRLWACGKQNAQVR